MQKIIEPIIFIIYLTSILLMGSYMIRNSVGNNLYKSFGSFALTLGLADGIYIVPRMYSVLTTGIEGNLRIIGWGRMGNSIIITILFLMLYDIYNIRYSKKKNHALNKTIYGLGLVRMIICLLPGNNWFELMPNYTFSILRLIPLSIISIFLILIIYLHSKKFNDKNFIFICIAIFVTTLFIEPQIFIQEPSFGLSVLTIIRTIGLTTIILVGYKELRDINVLSRY